ncbi:hypothetical protein [Brevibacillus sp. SIMBA_040]|uniref:hypothetical protein n=1 Tax=unclassified Brevibacillus TaxID=2684853 RepID=UPI00397AF344
MNVSSLHKVAEQVSNSIKGIDRTKYDSCFLNALEEIAALNLELLLKIEANVELNDSKQPAYLKN